MKLLRLLAVAAVAAFAGVTSANAEVINFDDIAGTFSYIPNGYDGLAWGYFAAINGAGYAGVYGPNGYTNGVVSSPNVGCGCGADFGQTYSYIYGPNLTLTSGWFTSAWNDGETLTVVGLLGNTVEHVTQFTINTEGPVFWTFNWTGINTLVFLPSGGTNVGLNGAGEYFALDDLTISSSVPEPLTLSLFGAGLVGAAALRRRKKNVV